MSLSATIHTREGLVAPDQEIRREGALGLTWARGWRDGSVGWLMELDLAESRAGDAQAAPSVLAAPAIVDGLLQIRAFPEGRLLAVSGAEPWVGGDAHLELFEPLWWMLVPPAPDDAGGPSVHSWVWEPAGMPETRFQHQLEWVREEKQGKNRSYRYTGTSTGTGVALESRGTMSGQVRFEGARVVSHAVTLTREATTRWPSGAVVQEHTLTLRLEYIGSETGPRVRAYAYDDPREEQAPLELVDGRTVASPPVVHTVALPFVVVPGDLSARPPLLGLP